MLCENNSDQNEAIRKYRFDAALGQCECQSECEEKNQSKCFRFRSHTHSDFLCDPAEDRTPDPLIKSQLLYQLSYRVRLILSHKSKKNIDRVGK